MKQALETIGLSIAESTFIKVRYMRNKFCVLRHPGVCEAVVWLLHFATGVGLPRIGYRVDLDLLPYSLRPFGIYLLRRLFSAYSAPIAASARFTSSTPSGDKGSCGASGVPTGYP